MKRKYQGSTRVKRAQLQVIRRDFEILQMQKGETVNDYIGKGMSLGNTMRMHGDSITDLAIVETILRSFTPKFDYNVCSIEEENNVEEMQIDELQSSLLVNEQKLNCTSAIEEMTALKIFILGEASISRGRGQRRSRGRGRGSRERSREVGRSADLVRDDYDNKGKGYFDKSKVECYRCGRLGHYKNECYTRLKKEKGEQFNFVEKREEETVLMSFHTMKVADQGVWVVDSGCSNHMPGCKEFFSTLDEIFRTTVCLGNNATIQVMGKRVVNIKTRNDFVESSNVFYILDLKANLLSIGQLQEKSYVITF